jgi:RES domain-containing protein
MRLWRLSSLRRARDFDGGYGLANSGRWNTTSRPVTYCSTVPSLTALEKRVHVTDASLLAPQAMVEYDVPDNFPAHNILFSDLPSDWALRETLTQRLGDAWLDQCAARALCLRSACHACQLGARLCVARQLLMQLQSLQHCRNPTPGFLAPLSASG